MEYNKLVLWKTINGTNIKVELRAIFTNRSWHNRLPRQAYLFSTAHRSSRHSIRRFNKCLEVFSASRVSIGGYWYLTTYPQLSTCARYCCIESGMTITGLDVPDICIQIANFMADATHDYECNLRSRTIDIDCIPISRI